MEMAVLYQWDEPEILKMLAEFKEIPDDVKILQLMRMIFKGLGGEEFRKILHSVSSVETVKHLLSSQVESINPNIQVSVKDMRGNGTLLQLAVTENKQDLVRLLLEFGFVAIS